MKKYKNLIYITIIFIVTFILLIKLFIFDRYQGHDTVFHVTNIIELSKTISLDNIFGSNIITYNLNKFGYGIWLFYPKLPHLLASYIYLFTEDIYLSMNIIYFITTFLSGVFTYFLSKKIFKDSKVALLSSVIYLTVPYHICEIYIRDAFAENFMFLVLPMIFLGLYNLKENNYLKFYILFSLGYIIGMNSHLVSMFFYTIFVLLFILYYHEYFFVKEKIKVFIISALIVTWITLPFLTTLIEHKLLNIYIVFTGMFSSLDGVLYSSLNFNSLFNQRQGYNKIMTYFNIMTIILFVVSLLFFIFDKSDNNKRNKKIILLLIILVVNFICSKVIWTYVPKLLLSIQFPWRLLVLLSMLISLFAPLFLLSKKILNKVKNILISILIVVVTLEGISNIDYYLDREVSEELALKLTLGMGFQYEYLPFSDGDIYCSVNYGKFCFEISEYKINTNNDVVVDITNDEFPNMEFEINNIDEDAVIELPRMFYLGYVLRDEDGKKIELYKSDHGFLEAKINKNGIYKLVYEKTKWNKIADVIRVLTIIIVIVSLGVKKLRWKRKK